MGMPGLTTTRYSAHTCPADCDAPQTYSRRVQNSIIVVWRVQAWAAGGWVQYPSDQDAWSRTRKNPRCTPSTCRVSHVKRDVSLRSLLLMTCASSIISDSWKPGCSEPVGTEWREAGLECNSRPAVRSGATRHVTRII